MCSPNLRGPEAKYGLDAICFLKGRVRAAGGSLTHFCGLCIACASPKGPGIGCCGSAQLIHNQQGTIKSMLIGGLSLRLLASGLCVPPGNPTWDWWEVIEVMTH